jgi:hypothetical protein
MQDEEDAPAPDPPWRWLGYIYVRSDHLLSLYGARTPSEDEMLGRMAIELDMYEKWYNGEVYQYEALTPDGHEFSNGCGYYDVDEAIAEARYDIDHHIESLERAECAKGLCKSERN